ncbi:MAG: HAMP domain-containing histidine kinase [Myxococcales bacterium]|nr:HAMP domain-containing histidine kinase [Myxococcales bacterium]
MGHSSDARSTRPEAPPRHISREMALGFGTVSLVALATCGLLLLLIRQVSALVTGMTAEETAIRQGSALARAVREQYIHLARASVEGDARHLEHFRHWQAEVREALTKLLPFVPAAEGWRVPALGQTLEALGNEVPPEGTRQVPGTLAASHPAIARLADEASAQADALAEAVASRMAHSHVLATQATQLGLLYGGLGAFVIVGLSVGFTLRLRHSVLKPLGALTAAAQRFGSGAFEARVGAVGRGELRALSQAFDRMAEELAERQRRVVHNERMAAIGHLAAGVAHELNNPIGIIRGYLKTMEAKEDPETLEEELRILDEEAGHCQRIAEDLLAYARPAELRCEPLRMKAFVEETLRRFAESPDGRGRPVVAELQDGTLLADPTRLRQVLLNLVANAAQVSPPGVPVTVRGEDQGETYRLEVIDRGPGIALEDQGRIFEPFFTKRRGGSGLGLSVCLGIVQAHGGRVQVVSREGEGSRFEVVLPKHAAAGGLS